MEGVERGRRIPTWLATTIVAEGVLACLSLSLLVIELAWILRGDPIFDFKPTGAVLLVAISSGIPAALLVFAVLVVPLGRAWWSGGWKRRVRGCLGIALSVWFLLNMGSVTVLGPGAAIPPSVIFAATVGTIVAFASVLGLAIFASPGSSAQPSITRSNSA